MRKLGCLLCCIHHTVVDTTNFQLFYGQKDRPQSPPGPPWLPRYSTENLHNQFPHLQRANIASRYAQLTLFASLYLRPCCGHNELPPPLWRSPQNPSTITSFHTERANIASKYAQPTPFARCVHYNVADTTNFHLLSGEKTLSSQPSNDYHDSLEAPLETRTISFRTRKEPTYPPNMRKLGRLLRCSHHTQRTSNPQ